MANKKEKYTRIKKLFKKFFKYFSKWTLIGVVLILGSIIVADEFDNQYVAIISDVIETIGIAMVVGAVFDFSKNSAEFTDFISNLLSDIIISKEFLKKLSKEDKKEALSLVLQPSDKQVELYSNINEYFKKQLDTTMKLFNTNFKSHFVLNIEVFRENGIVVSKGVMSYRIYKIQDNFEPIKVSFEREDSKVQKKRILYPGGTHIIDTTNDMYRVKQEAGVDYTTYSYDIPEELNKYPYLTVESDIYEPGYDHWTNFKWTSLTPYDGLTFNLTCKDGLVIHEHIIFDDKVNYSVVCSENKQNIRIISTEWLNTHSGFYVTIGEPSKKEENVETVDFSINNESCENSTEDREAVLVKK